MQAFEVFQISVARIETMLQPGCEQLAETSPFPATLTRLNAALTPLVSAGEAVASIDMMELVAAGEDLLAIHMLLGLTVRGFARLAQKSQEGQLIGILPFGERIEPPPASVDVDLGLTAPSGASPSWCDSAPAGTRVYVEFDLDMLRARTWALSSMGEPT